MRHEGAESLGAGDQRGDPLGLAGIEVRSSTVSLVFLVDAGVWIHHFEMRRELAQDSVARGAIDHVGDDDRTVALKAFDDLGGRVLGTDYGD